MKKEVRIRSLQEQYPNWIKQQNLWSQIRDSSSAVTFRASYFLLISFASEISATQNRTKQKVVSVLSPPRSFVVLDETSLRLPQLKNSTQVLFFFTLWTLSDSFLTGTVPQLDFFVQEIQKNAQVGFESE